MSNIPLHVLAIPVVQPDDMDPEDTGVPGVYSVSVEKGLSEQTMASAALDLFHETIPVTILDDFAFYVIDPGTGRVLEQDEDAESYANGHLASDLEQIGDEVPGVFTVAVSLLADNGEHSAVGQVSVAASTETEAEQKAKALLWDNRLDSASCTPRYITTRVDSNEAQPA
jgi:hypothetical protein